MTTTLRGIPSRRRTGPVRAALAGAAVLALSACGSTAPTAQERDAEQQAEGEAAGGPITLTDSAGRTVELPGPAEDVAVLEWGQTEAVLTLGVTPVAVADPAGYTTWDTAEALPGDVDSLDVGMRGSVNKDAVLAKDPDVIIVDEGGDLDVFEDSGVPVVVAASADAADPIAQMEETFTLIAQTLGKEDEAEEVLADLDASMGEAQEAVAAADPETTRFVYADGYVTGSTLAIRPFGQGSLVGELGEAAGLTNAWEGEVDPAYGLGQTDVEGLTAVEDARFLYTDTESSDWLGALEGNRLWDGSSFVTEDQVTAFPTGVWTFGGPRSAQQVLDGFVDAVS